MRPAVSATVSPTRLAHLAPLVLVATGLLAYLNSWRTPFLFDDAVWIVENPHITTLSLRGALTPPPLSTSAARPVVAFTFAINYALGQLHVLGYHLVNTAIHLLAGLLLFGIVRRTLLLTRLAPRATGIACVAALVWLVHPLQTGSVTYIVQRTESLAGLWYLLTLYSVIRATAGPHPRRWHALALLACALGMGTKPVMATAPLLVWGYDRTFLAGSWRAAWRVRRGLYVGLMATWALLALTLRLTPRVADITAGFGITSVTPLAYLATQPSVLVYYLRLALWPNRLCLDYAWPLAKAAGEIVPFTLIILALLVATGWAWRRHPALGFLGVWFFLILAPSSSLIPIADVAFEHRMYLPLAAVILAAVLGADALLRRVGDARRRGLIAAGLTVVVGGALVLATVRRNDDYRSEIAMWTDVIAKRPGHARAHNNLGLGLVRQGRLDEGIAYFREAITIDPRFAPARNNLGLACLKQGKLDEAIAHLTAALALDPAYAKARDNLGLALMKQGKLDEAILEYQEALRLQPLSAKTHHNLAFAFAANGDVRSARAHFVESLRLDPLDAEARNNFGALEAQEGHLEAAVVQFREVVRLDPTNATARRNLEKLLEPITPQGPTR